MKRKSNKKGFTIVELVIVIAVIAILSAVMVPTFTGIVKKAKESAAMQEANTAARAVAGTYEEGIVPSVEGVDAYVVIDDTYYFTVEGNKIEAVEKPDDVVFVAVGEEYPTTATAGDKAYRAHAENASVYVFEKTLTASDFPVLE